MKAGVQAIIRKIGDDARQHSHERYEQIKSTVDEEIDGENAMYSEESHKQLEAFRMHNEYEYERRLEYQRSRLNREMLVYQHELIDELFEMTVARLREISGDEFVKILGDGVKGLEGSYILHLGEYSAGRIDELRLKEVTERNHGLEITLSAETIARKSGFILRDDRVEYNHLFEDLIEDMKNEKTATLMKEIFGNSGDWMFA